MFINREEIENMIDDILKLLPEFETLLRTKSFSDLTSSEKFAVLKFMTTEEYETMRSNAARVIESFYEEEKYLVIDKNVEDALLSRLRKKKKKSFSGIAGISSLILGFKIPVYQVALLLLAGLFLIPKSNPKIVTKTLPVLKIDTIFIEKSINSVVPDYHRTQTGNMYPIGKKHISNQQISQIRPVLSNQNSPYFANIVSHFQSEKIGRPIESDSNLYWRLVTVQSIRN
jgi:hypothetical protein